MQSYEQASEVIDWNYCSNDNLSGTDITFPWMCYAEHCLTRGRVILAMPENQSYSRVLKSFTV